jgi:virulence plasmid B protein
VLHPVGGKHVTTMVCARPRIRGRGYLSVVLKGAATAVWLSCLSLPSTAQMALPGTSEVSATGAATYTVPIAAPPGTAGMSPSPSVEYNSQAGNGIVGIGWTLSGMPAIGRCPRTVAQDGAVGGINYDANDRFCLDGQRLMAITGTYGADGTEYRTEIESFARVISHGTAGTGPAWFDAPNCRGDPEAAGLRFVIAGLCRACGHCRMAISGR